MDLDEAAECRQWFADCIMAGSIDASPGYPIADVLALAEKEGVAGLLARLPAAATWTASEKSALEGMRQGAAMRELAGLSEARRAYTTLADSGIRFLALKGNALAYWLYDSPVDRPRVDVDVLVDSERTARSAALALGQAGFSPVDGVMPGCSAEFEVALQRKEGGGRSTIDLHWHFLNHARLSSVMSFDTLWAASIPIPELHPAARGLGRLHALVHALLHRVTNFPTGRQDRLIWLYDIHLLASGCSLGDWQGLLEVCRDGKVATPCLDGLHATRAAFSTRIPPEVEQSLERLCADEGWRLEKLDAGAMDRAHLAALPWKQKFHWLWRKLVPSPEFMRYRYGASGGWGLMLAYARRWVIGLFRAFGN